MISSNNINVEKQDDSQLLLSSSSSLSSLSQLNPININISPIKSPMQIPYKPIHYSSGKIDYFINITFLKYKYLFFII
jgi:hypothetical protein